MPCGQLMCKLHMKILIVPARILIALDLLGTLTYESPRMNVPWLAGGTAFSSRASTLHTKSPGTLKSRPCRAGGRPMLA